MAKRVKTDYVLPSSFYGNPEKVVDNEKMWEKLEFYQKREQGCKACRFQQSWGKHSYCSIGRRPAPRYCHGWREIEDSDE